jgi:hypothetical protein
VAYAKSKALKADRIIAMEAQHYEPVWRHKADYAIGIKVLDKVWSKKYQWEQLAARRLDDGTFEICCIPFAIYDLCLGDIVVVDSDMNVTGVIKLSGHFGFRVATADLRQQDAIIEQIHELGFLTERFSDFLFALDAVDEESAQYISGILAEAERNNDIVEYETLKTH